MNKPPPWPTKPLGRLSRLNHPQPPLAGLTEREKEVLRYIAQGLTYVQIAEKLVVSPRTVDAHLRSIYGKLGVKSRHEAARVAVERGLISNSPLP